MGVKVSQREVLNQSQQVFDQFGESKWIPNCKINAKLSRGDINSLKNSGVGKFLLLVAMGASLEDNIEIIKKYRDRFDILTCDKGFGALLEHGVKADFVMLCDASIPFKYLEKYVDQTEGVKLISTCYGNPEWTTVWKGEKFFYINKDSITSEHIFMPLMGDNIRLIPAGSNVSNAMLVFFTGSDNTQNINWSGYENFLLVGYDYSWQPDGNYYAWLDPKPKRFYMNHRTMIDYKGKVIFTSENLLFSSKWLYSYITTFGLPVLNCSERGILNINCSSLEKEVLKINPDKSKREIARQLFEVAKNADLIARQTLENFEKARRELWQTETAVSKQ